MRIVGGRFKGRVLAAPKGWATRPTADRVRESLFDILMSQSLAAGRDGLAGLRVLDAFAGSGALGFEALSRGAAHATFMESDPAACAVIAANIKKLGAGEQAALLRLDATNPPKPAAPCDLLLLDPPYGSGLAAPALAALMARGWVAPGAQAIVEVGASESFALETGRLAIAEERRYGAARLVFLRAI